jgi:exonuclease VII small subunit
MGRALLSFLGLGAAAALTATGGPVAGGIAAGLAANITTDAYKCLNRSLAERFIDGFSGIDENHHVNRGLRLAQINGLRSILQTFDDSRATDPNETRRREANRFSGEVKKFLARETTAAQGMGFSTGAGITADEQKIRLAVLEKLPDAFDTGLAARRAAKDQTAIAESLQQLREALEAGVLEEIRLQTLTPGEDFPSGFVSLFEGQNRHDGWFDLFIRDAAAKIKEGEDFEQIWNAEQIALIKADVRQMAGVLGKVDKRTESMDEKLNRLLAYAEAGGVVQRAAEQGISEAAVRSIVERLGGQGIELKDLIPWLDKWIESAVIELSRMSNEGDAYEAAYREAQRRFQAGRMDEASAAFMDELRREETREAERQEEHKRKQTRLLEGAIRFDALALEEPAIAQKLRMMAKIEGVDSAGTLGEWLFAKAAEFYEIGDSKGSNPDLFIAIAAYRAALEERTQARVPLDWAATQNNLGNALRTLGERESGTARLEEAVQAFRAALQEYTQDRVPLDWAMTQNNLGNALQTLGERESGTARLEEAVQAYRAALQEHTQARVPLAWAMTQINLGNALATLGERESGTARLEEAVQAYRAALQEYTQTRVPLHWATTQNNLGTALQTLGSRESGTARLEEAVQAYQAALQERTQARVPLDWAATQNNLGNALATLGERESGTARLEEAVQAHRAALQERTQTRVPPAWATTQYNLANALTALAGRQKSAPQMAEALACMNNAVDGYTQCEDHYWLPIAQRRVTEIESALPALQT